MHQDAQDLPWPWIVLDSEEYDSVYYFNEMTGETSWDPPAVVNEDSRDGKRERSRSLRASAATATPRPSCAPSLKSRPSSAPSMVNAARGDSDRGRSRSPRAGISTARPLGLPSAQDIDGQVTGKTFPLPHIHGEEVLPRDSTEKVDAHGHALTDADRAFLWQVRDAIMAAKAVDPAAFEGVIPFGDFLRALETQGLTARKLMRRFKRTRFFARCWGNQTAFFREHFGDLVDIQATQKINRLSHSQQEHAPPADSIEEADARFLRQIRDAILAAKAADPAAFEGVILFGDFLRALDMQGVRKITSKLKQSMAFKRFECDQAAFFREYFSDLVNTATKKEFGQLRKFCDATEPELVRRNPRRLATRKGFEQLRGV